jgi:hypothetical protein
MKNASFACPLSLRLSCLLAVTVFSPALQAAPKARAVVKKTAAKSKTQMKPAAHLDDGVIILSEGSAMMPVTIKRSVVTAKAGAASQSQTNARLLNFCRAYLGRKLGNGQCSELAVYGLPAARARLDFNNLWGSTVCQFSGVNGSPTVNIPGGKRGQKPDIRPGDLIQYEGVKFEKHWEGGYSFKEYPHHTSVIEHVSRDGLTLTVLEQNVGGTQYVLRTKLFMPELTAGTMRVTRPIPLG